MHANGTPGWPDVAIYRDELTPRHRRSHSTEALTERATMLRPTHRRGGTETIYVATLAVMAWTPEDWMDAMAAASARNASVVALDSSRIIPPNAGAADFTEALKEFMAGRRRSQTSDGRRAAAEVLAARRRVDVVARCKLIEEDWKGRVVATVDLLLRAGRTPKGRSHVVPMAYATAVQILGKRPTAQKMRDAKIKRYARKTIEGVAVDITDQRRL